MSRCRTQDTCSSIVLLPKFFTLQLRYAVFPRSAVTFFDADRSKYGPVRVASVVSTLLARLLLLPLLLLLLPLLLLILLLLLPGRFTWLAVSFVVVCCCCCCWGCCLEASRCEPFTVSLMSRKTAIHSMQIMYVLVIVILNVLIPSRCCSAGTANFRNVSFSSAARRARITPLASLNLFFRVCFLSELFTRVVQATVIASGFP